MDKKPNFKNKSKEKHNIKNISKKEQTVTTGKINIKDKIININLPLIIEKNKDSSKETSDRKINNYDKNLLTFEIDPMKKPIESKQAKSPIIINKNEKIKQKIEIDVNTMMKNVKNNINNLNEQIEKLNLENKDLFNDNNLFDSKELILLKKEIILIKQQLEYYRKKSEFFEYIFFSTKNTIDNITSQQSAKEISMYQFIYKEKNISTILIIV